MISVKILSLTLELEFSS